MNEKGRKKKGRKEMRKGNYLKALMMMSPVLMVMVMSSESMGFPYGV